MNDQKAILVIEDNEDVRENICEILELAGYITIGAANGKIGVEYAVSKKPDLILCDVMMPELDGFGVLKILHKNINTIHIPFIFLTAKAEQTDLRKGMGLGADDYITKPFDDVDLLEAIEIRLNKSNANNTITTKPLANEPALVTINSAIQKLITNKEKRHFEPGSSIYINEQQARWLYWIDSGSIKTLLTNEIGKEIITDVYCSHSFLGLQNVLTGCPYHDSAVALESSQISLIPAPDFKKMLTADHNLLIALNIYLSEINKSKDYDLLNMAYGSVRKKTANVLLKLTRKNDDQIHLTREDLASIAGMAKESLIRTLSDFKNEGLIHGKGSIIIINDRSALEQLPL